MFQDAVSKKDKMKRIKEGGKSLPSMHGSGILRKYAIQEALKKAKRK